MRCPVIPCTLDTARVSSPSSVHRPSLMSLNPIDRGHKGMAMPCRLVRLLLTASCILLQALGAHAITRHYKFNARTTCIPQLSLPYHHHFLVLHTELPHVIDNI